MTSPSSAGLPAAAAGQGMPFGTGNSHVENLLLQAKYQFAVGLDAVAARFEVARTSAQKFHWFIWAGYFVSVVLCLFAACGGSKKYVQTCLQEKQAILSTEDEFSCRFGKSKQRVILKAWSSLFSRFSKATQNGSHSNPPHLQVEAEEEDAAC